MGYVKFTETFGEISKTYEFESYEDFKDWENGQVMVNPEELFVETDGWIENKELRHPNLTGDTIVEVLFRDGSTDQGEVCGWAWHHTQEPDDVMSYRVVSK